MNDIDRRHNPFRSRNLRTYFLSLLPGKHEQAEPPAKHGDGVVLDSSTSAESRAGHVLESIKLELAKYDMSCVSNASGSSASRSMLGASPSTHALNRRRRCNALRADESSPAPSGAPCLESDSRVPAQVKSGCGSVSIAHGRSRFPSNWGSSTLSSRVHARSPLFTTRTKKRTDSSLLQLELELELELGALAFRVERADEGFMTRLRPATPRPPPPRAARRRARAPRTSGRRWRTSPTPPRARAAEPPPRSRAAPRPR